MNSGNTNNNSNGNPRFHPRNVEPRWPDTPFASICFQVKQKGHNSSATSQKAALTTAEHPSCSTEDGEVALINFSDDGTTFELNAHVTHDLEKGPSGQD